MSQLKKSYYTYFISILFLSSFSFADLLKKSERGLKNYSHVFYYPKETMTATTEIVKEAYIKNSDLLKSFFIEEQTKFNPKSPQTNSTLGPLEMRWFSEISENQIIQMTNMQTGKQEPFYNYFCRNFFKSRIFLATKIEEKYPANLCEEDTGNKQGYIGQFFFQSSDAAKRKTGIFKIHLQANPNYHIWTLLKFFEFLLKEEGIEKTIPSFKTNFLYLSQTVRKGSYLHSCNSTMPSLIIYVDSRGGIDSLLEITTKLRNHFISHSSLIGSHYIPRFNFNIDKLINVAVGGSNEKQDQIYLLKKIQEKLDSKKAWTLAELIKSLKEDLNSAIDQRLIVNPLAAEESFIQRLERNEIGIARNESFLQSRTRTKKDVLNYIRVLSSYVPVNYYRRDVYDESNFVFLNSPHTPYDISIRKTRLALGLGKTLAKPLPIIRRSIMKHLKEVMVSHSRTPPSLTSLREKIRNTRALFNKKEINLESLQSVLSFSYKQPKFKSSKTSKFSSYSIENLLKRYPSWFYSSELERIKESLHSSSLNLNFSTLKTLLKKKRTEDTPIWLERLYLKAKLELKYP